MRIHEVQTEAQNLKLDFMLLNIRGINSKWNQENRKKNIQANNYSNLAVTETKFTKKLKLKNCKF